MTNETDVALESVSEMLSNLASAKGQEYAAKAAKAASCANGLSRFAVMMCAGKLEAAHALSHALVPMCMRGVVELSGCDEEDIKALIVALARATSAVEGAINDGSLDLSDGEFDD